MRKLSRVCLLSVAYTAFFMGCKKDDTKPFTPHTPPSVIRQVLAHAVENHDFKHITAQHLEEADLPTTTPNSNEARFVITYFSFFEGEKDTVFNDIQLFTTLVAAGLSEEDARRHTDCLFKTYQCSPVFLTETAQLIAPVLPSHTTGTFICELFRPCTISTIQTQTGQNSVSRTNYPKKKQYERIKAVNKLVGVSGSVSAFGGTRIEVYFNQNDSNAPNIQHFDAQEIRVILQKTRGYTEGEAMYLKLILGTLTELDVWSLFENEVVPEWQRAHNTYFNTRIARLYFRYNYVEIIANIGRVGFSIYDLDGFVD